MKIVKKRGKIKAKTKMVEVCRREERESKRPRQRDKLT